MPTPCWLLHGKGPGDSLPSPFFSFPSVTGMSLKTGLMVPLASLRTPLTPLFRWFLDISKVRLMRHLLFSWEIMLDFVSGLS